MEPLRRARILRLLFFLLGSALGVGFGLYFWSLYGQLTQAFFNEEKFTPTRIYSDVFRMSPLQPRAQIEERLKSLGYAYVHGGNSTRFTLRVPAYPFYLLPDGHPLTNQKTPLAVNLTFQTTESGMNVLQSIQLAGKPIPDLFLEPELIATLSRTGETGRSIRKPVQFDEVPAPIWKAIIAIEDQHFLEHKGFDPRGFARAIWVNLKTRSLAQGGSTITQQLVKNLMVRRSKNIFKKVNEVFLALLLEAKIDKEKILERYLNEVYLGQVGSFEVHGVAEGAEHFFGKRLQELNLAETALMAGLIRGPGYYSPYRHKARALERQRLVLRKMVETGQIAEGEASAALRLPIRLAPPQTVTTRAPFFTDYVKAELIRLLGKKFSEEQIVRAGFRVYSTLDARLNAIGQKTVQEMILDLEHRLKLEPTERLEGALAAVDHTTGFIRVLVGGRNYAESNFNRILNMKRQVGSTFKPVVYLTAFQKGEDAQGIPYGPGHPAEDAPWTLTYDHGKQSWSPKNYDKEYLGWISYRTALCRSINSVAAKLGVEVGIPNIIQTARRLGIRSELPAVPSLSLGVGELSPIELVQVYSVIANRGKRQEMTVIRGITLADGTGYARFIFQPEQVLESPPIQLLTDILQDVFTEGTARAAQKMGFTRPAAGKTGTTSNHRDAWFAGFVPQLTTVVWVGMDQDTQIASPSPSPVSSPGPGPAESRINLTGAGSALPIWVAFTKRAFAGQPPAPFPESPDLIGVSIDRHTGKVSRAGCPEAQVKIEKFIQGREPKESSCEPNWPPSVPQTNLD